MLGVASSMLGFFSGPAGRVALIGLAFLAWGAYQRIDATSDCKEDELRRDLIEAQRQLEIAQGISENARSRADEAERKLETLEGLADEIRTDIESSGAGCVIDDATAERLRRIN